MNYKKKSLLNRTYKQFMETGLNSTGLISLDKIVEKNVTGFGSAIDEKISGVKALKKLLQNQKKQSKGVRLQWKIKPVSRQITADNNSAVYADDIFLTLHAGSEIIKMYLRFSVVLNYINDQWKVVHWHGSKPEQVQSEEDTYGIDSLKQKNAELEKLVEEKTVDLSTKNRELQIETALEKVRAVAMGMKQRDDMLNICKTISQQMTILGVKEIRNVQTAIIYKEKGTYINYEFYTRYGKTFITPTNYTEYKAHNKWALQMLGGMEKLVNIHLEKQELKKWIAYQKTTNVFIDKYLDTAASLDYYWYSLGSVALGISTYEPLSEDEMNLFQRFRNVFELAYKRYVDIATAAAQSREAHIEAALEKVRSSSLAMHRSDELQGVVNTVIDRLKVLNIILDTTNILIFNDKEKRIEFWTGSNSTGTQLYTSWKVPYADFLYYKQIRQARESKQEIFAGNYSFEEKNKMYHYLFTQTDFRHLNPERKKFILKSPGATIVSGIENDIAIQIISYSRKAFTSDEIEIVKRFAKVFNQAYTRFLDLQKAEMQTREAQIQLALERVRAKSLAMHHSSELQEVANITAQQLHGIGMDINGGVFICLNKEAGNELTIWASGGMADYIQKANVPFLNKPIYTRLRNAIKKGNNFLIEWYSKKEKQELFTHLFQYEPWRILPQKRKKELLSREGGFARSVAISRNTSISITNHNGKAFTDKENEILKRFGKVFEQSYTRFLDLQKAEAQAREAQIEASLERVRSRTMAMHQASELQEVIHTVHNELIHLNISIDGGSFVVINKDVKSFLCCWGSGGTANTSTEILVPDFNMPFCTNLINGIKKGPGFFTEEFSQKEKKQYFTKLFKHKPWSDISASEKKETLSSPGGYTRSVAVFKHTSIFIINHQGRKFTEEENNILKRFAKVFEQTYTRFLDLQKAEAQAREAQIEAGLEKVRSCSLAMHKSEELNEVVKVVLDKLKSLDINLEGKATSLVIFIEEKMELHFWLLGPNAAYAASTIVPFTKNAVISKLWEAKGKGKKFITHVFSKKVKNDYWNWAFTQTSNNILPEEAKRRILKSDTYSYSAALAKKSGIFISSSKGEILSSEEGKLLGRFANVFDQAYIRFLDLQKAEAQAREAQIEAGLERVRANAMAMQSSEELKALIGTVFTELTKLDLALTRCIIWVFEPTTNAARWWMANSEEPSNPMSFYIKYHKHPAYLKFVQEWKNQNVKFVYDLKGEAKRKWDEILFNETELTNLPAVVKDGMKKPERVLLSASFNNFGGINVASLEPLSEEHFDILLRFAKVFDLSYTRFNDLKQAEAQARESQIQLALERVRARTMAMQRSDELTDVATLLFKQVSDLGIKTWTTGFNVWSDNNNFYTDYITNPQGGFVEPYTVDASSFHVFAKMSDAKKRGDDFYIHYGERELLAETYRHLSKFGEKQFKAIQELGFQFPEKQYEHVVFGSKASLLFITYEPVPEAHDIFKRFGKVFEQTYTRFLDLQKAEAQARESQIQLALERVRARTMAMHKSNELSEVAVLLFDQVKELGIDAWTCGYNIWCEDKKAVTAWMSRGAMLPEYKYPLTENPTLKHFYEAAQRGESLFVEEVSGETLTELYRYLGTIHASEGILDAVRTPGYSPPAFQVNHAAYFTYGYLLLVTYKPYPEAHDIFKRFAAVFDQTYTRFLDLQKAEAQARESQIQLALERVRARTMAMHKSEELSDASAILFHELTTLGIKTIRSGFGIYDEPNNAIITWLTTISNELVEQKVLGSIPITVNDAISENYEAWKNKQSFLCHEFVADEVKEYYDSLSPYINLPLVKPNPRESFSAFFFSEGSLNVISYDLLTTEECDLLLRFTHVFELTYRRFLDLQKAEAQAREAQIESALERVRAKAMAMHSSEDVTSATVIMFAELEKLGIKNFRCGINHIKTDRTQEVWSVTNSAEGKTIQSVGSFDIDDHPFWKKMYEAWMEKKEFLYDLLTGNEKEKYVRILNATPNYLSRPIMDFPDVHFSVYFFGEGTVWAMTLQPPSEEDKQIMKRFASVFSLTFRRYHDLLKAEAQAKEAKIEAALERVRSKAMAMHSSQDLADTIGVFYKELQLFSFTPLRCGVGLLNKENKEGEIFTWNTTKQGESLELVGKIKMDGHPVLKKVYSNWLTQTEYHPVLRGNEIKEYYKTIRPMMAFPDYHNDTVQYGYFFFFNEGGVYAWTENEMKEDELQIYRRFSSVLSLTYKRYKDIQQAEANAKDAIKQSALDRIRADIASMRTVDDLDRITPLIWNELTIIGIPFIRCGVFIMDEKQELIHTFLSTPDGKAIAAVHIPYDTPGKIKRIPENWRQKLTYTDHWNDPDFIDFANALLQQHAIESADQYLSGVPHGGFYLHFIPFLQGMLYVGNPTELNGYEINLIQSVADAFSTAYARYEDFNKLEAAKKQVDSTLVELQATQKQLIQSEKMASLGELTAGIAHEIQNPLNFVNNFSEVSKELLDEMKEVMDKGDPEEAKEIMQDVINNLEKIYHHGKRADAIVKGMLQHSRSSSGQKEMTDINALCNEYLRLAYHGLRAKDKSFNAKYETYFDESLPKISVVPQEIGRVILNLINNAFYAVGERSKAGGADRSIGTVNERKKINEPAYEPTVTVSTKRESGKVLISVKDNGPGIPESIVNKIFQPFFTTKPTGSGTGLGLSLSYDIIKAHGGEIKVNTKEGKETEFIISL